MADEAELNSDPTNSDAQDTIGDGTVQEASEEMSLEERRKLGGEVDQKYTAWREPRRTHELQWF